MLSNFMAGGLVALQQFQKQLVENPDQFETRDSIMQLLDQLIGFIAAFDFPDETPRAVADEANGPEEEV
jgi:hypothetical protein